MLNVSAMEITEQNGGIKGFVYLLSLNDVPEKAAENQTI